MCATRIINIDVFTMDIGAFMVVALVFLGKVHASCIDVFMVNVDVFIMNIGVFMVVTLVFIT